MTAPMTTVLGRRVTCLGPSAWWPLQRCVQRRMRRRCGASLQTTSSSARMLLTCCRCSLCGQVIRFASNERERASARRRDGWTQGTVLVYSTGKQLAIAFWKRKRHAPTSALQVPRSPPRLPLLLLLLCRATSTSRCATRWARGTTLRSQKRVQGKI